MPNAETKPTDSSTLTIDGHKVRKQLSQNLMRQPESSHKEKQNHNIELDHKKCHRGSRLYFWFIKLNSIRKDLTHPETADCKTLSGIKVGMGQQVNMAVSEGLMSARLNARPGPQIHREGVRRYTPCIN